MAEKETSGKGGNAGNEPEIVIVEEGDDGSAVDTRSAEDRQQAGVYDRDDDDEGATGGADERLGATPGAGETGGGDEGKQDLSSRQRRRQRERDARNAERAELARLRSENEQLRGHAVATDRRITNVETSAIDQQINGIEDEIRKANAVMSRAMAAQNGDDFVQAQEIRDVLRDRLGELKRVKTSKEAAGKGEGRDGGAGGDARTGAEAGGGWKPTREQVFNARMFLQRHPWYKINGNDDDSRTVTSIDNEMMAEGGNPSSAEYWQELERRVYAELPQHAPKARDTAGGDGGGGGGERTGRANGNGNGRAGGPRLPGGGGSGGAGGGAVKFHLSAARKQALVDLGVWDDPDLRMKHIKRFIQWDKDHSNTQ